MRLTGLILATVGFVTSANAEFVMVSPPATGTTPATPGAFAGADETKASPKPSTRRARPCARRLRDHVPLRFAVRQIVPARFQVAFGETVDRDARSTGKAARPGAPRFPTLSARSVSPFPWSAPR